MDIESILSRFSGVKQTSSDTWIGLCSSHPDKNPSLSFRRFPNGNTGLKCWAYCTAGEIVSGAGLELKDLFANPKTPSRNFRISKTEFENAKHLIAFHNADRKSGYLWGRPTKADLESLRLAAGVVREYRRERAR